MKDYFVCMQAKQDPTELQEKSKEIKQRIQEVEAQEQEVINARDAALQPIGNLVHDTVPISDNEVCRFDELSMVLVLALTHAS